jgi:two-component system OmpR family response regulator
MQGHDALPLVLLVEDDPDIQELATMALESIGGLPVRTCSDGAAALAEAEACKPDLIILDWRMPVLNGGQTLLRLKENPATRHIPVIFMTASVQPGQVGQMRAMGAVDVIPKPFDPVELPKLVVEIWRRARQQGNSAQ